MSEQRRFWRDCADAQARLNLRCSHIRAPSSEFVSSSIPSWQILTAHAQPFRGARDLVFCLMVLMTHCLYERAAEVLARLRRCAGSPEPSLLAYMSPVKRICVFEHSVMTNFNYACPAIQRGQGSGFLSDGSSWLTACMSEQRRFWPDCAGSPEPSLLA